MLPSGKTKGKKETSTDLILLYKNNPGAFRLTVVVTKKIAPRAVDRNRIKRLIREALRVKTQLRGELKIIVKNNMSGLKLDEVSKKLEPLIRQVK